MHAGPLKKTEAANAAEVADVQNRQTPTSGTSCDATPNTDVLFGYHLLALEGAPALGNPKNRAGMHAPMRPSSPAEDGEVLMPILAAQPIQRYPD